MIDVQVCPAPPPLAALPPLQSVSDRFNAPLNVPAPLRPAGRGGLVMARDAKPGKGGKPMG